MDTNGKSKLYPGQGQLKNKDKRQAAHESASTQQETGKKWQRRQTSRKLCRHAGLNRE